MLNTIRKPDLQAAAIGCGVGFMSGLFGIGGGVLLVPAFVLLLKLQQKLAHGSALVAGVFLSFSGATLYVIGGNGNFAAAALVFIGSFSGVLLGTWLLKKIEVRILMYVFLAVLVVTAVRLFIGSGNTPGEAAYESLTLWLVLGFIATGLVAGTLSGLLGIGGGIIMVPSFILLFGFSAVVAKGTSLMVIVPTGTTGTLRNSKYGNINLRVGLLAGIGGVPMALFGAWVSSRMSDVLSEVLFGVLMVVVAANMLRKTLQVRRETSASDPSAANIPETPASVPLTD